MGWFSRPNEPEDGTSAAPEQAGAPAPAPPAPLQPPAEADASTRASLASLLTGRPSPAPTEDAIAHGEDTASVFAESVDIEGSLEGQGDVVLRGRVRGSINISGSLLVTQGGAVQADVCAREVINAGTVEGNITASEKVRVQATGLVKGDIDSPSIVIDDGGGVEGFVQMEPPGGEGDFDDDDLPPRPASPPPPASMRFPARTAAATAPDRVPEPQRGPERERGPERGSDPPARPENGRSPGGPSQAPVVPSTSAPLSTSPAAAVVPRTAAASAPAPPASAPKAPPPGDPLAVFFDEMPGERTATPDGNRGAGAPTDDPFAESDTQDESFPEL